MAMFSIGDFARLGNVSVRTLRYYEEVGVLLPAAVDPTTGYRSYSAYQLSRLHRIVALKDLGLSLRELAPLLDDLSCEECSCSNARRSNNDSPMTTRALLELSYVSVTSKENTRCPTTLLSRTSLPCGSR
jgi:DNA-binding transcriptional MerR regulator